MGATWAKSLWWQADVELSEVGERKEIFGRDVSSRHRRRHRCWGVHFLFLDVVNLEFLCNTITLCFCFGFFWLLRRGLTVAFRIKKKKQGEKTIHTEILRYWLFLFKEMCTQICLPLSALFTHKEALSYIPLIPTTVKTFDQNSHLNHS